MTPGQAQTRGASDSDKTTSSRGEARTIMNRWMCVWGQMQVSGQGGVACCSPKASAGGGCTLLGWKVELGGADGGCTGEMYKRGAGGKPAKKCL